MILTLLTGSLYSQIVIKGRVTDNEGMSMPGANVSIRETYDGASADTSG